jgi:general secretion pathway protein G
MKTYRSRKSGFTLVEILIVVIILGILAAIVIPQFTNASTDARRNSTSSLLQTIRSQVELYKLQHGDALPDLVTDWTPLINTSTFNGTTFGPYMQQIPVSPLNANSAVEDGPSGTTPGGGTGWVYDYNGGAGTGKFWATDATDTQVFNEADPTTPLAATP